MAPTDPITPAPRRFPVRQRLFELLVVVAIIYVLVALLLPPSTSSYDRWRELSPKDREIAEEIEKRGVSFVNLAGTEIIEFRMAGDPALVTDQTLETLQPKIRSELTFASQNLNQRLGFTLAHAQVTDAGLAYVTDLKMLRRLVLPERVTNSGLVRVAEMTELDDISLFWTQVTDPGIQHLLNLKNLRSLALPHITEAGIADLTAFEHLESLSIVGGCSDEGLKSIAGLTKLQDLTISSELITDAGVMHLQGLSRLKKLALTSTRVTGEGARRLLVSNPRLTVYLMDGRGPAQTFQGNDL
jgi:hypothetical protein